MVSSSMRLKVATEDLSGMVAPHAFTDNWLTANNTRGLTIPWARASLKIPCNKQQPQDKLQGFSTMGLGPGYYGESNVKPSPGQFHIVAPPHGWCSGLRRILTMCASPMKFLSVAEHGTVRQIPRKSSIHKNEKYAVILTRHMILPQITVQVYMLQLDFKLLTD